MLLVAIFILLHNSQHEVSEKGDWGFQKNVKIMF